MIYLFYSLIQRSFLKREVQKIIKSSLGTANEFNYIKFDAKETPVQEIVNACLEVPLIENKKVVVVDDAFFFSASKTREKINKENDYDVLAKYLKKPMEETDLVFLVYEDNIDKRNKLYKALADKATISSFAPLKDDDWRKYTAQLVNKKGLNIDGDAIYELAKRTINDRDRLINEIEKLSLYKDHISLNDVITFISEPLEDKAYLLTNALLKGDSASSLYIYRDLITRNIDPNLILISLMNQFRFYYVINYLNAEKVSVFDIANKLKASEARVRVSLMCSKAIKKHLINILDDLYYLDYKIKSSQIDRFYALELFINNFKNKYLK